MVGFRATESCRMARLAVQPLDWGPRRTAPGEALSQSWMGLGVALIAWGSAASRRQAGLNSTSAARANAAIVIDSFRIEMPPCLRFDNRGTREATIVQTTGYWRLDNVTGGNLGLRVRSTLAAFSSLPDQPVPSRKNRSEADPNPGNQWCCCGPPDDESAVRICSD